MQAAELKKSRSPTIKFDAKQSAQLAIEYFSDLFPSDKITNVALEEVEFSEDDSCWLITLGYDETSRSNDPSQITIPVILRLQKAVRKYKVFKVNARTGKVISMRIRKLE